MKPLVLKLLNLLITGGYIWIARRIDYYFIKSAPSLGPIDTIDPYPAANAIRERAPVCHFDDDVVAWSPNGDGGAMLTGQLFDGTNFTGSDSYPQCATISPQ